MSDRMRLRAAMLTMCVELVPPMIRDDLLSDAQLRRDFGFDIDAVLTFGDADIAFKRSTLFAAVRAAGSRLGKVRKVLDQAGTEWDVVATNSKGAADLIIKSGSRTLHAGRLLLLTKNKKLRKAYFSDEAERLNLPTATIKRWSALLDKHPLSTEEIGELMTDVSHTPVAVTDRLIQHLSNAKVTLDVLVPRSLDYYERLVGRIEGQTDIKEYITEVAAAHIHALLKWRVTDGLRQALLMGTHSLIANVIAQESVSATEFDKLAEWAKGADAIARGATLEIALKRSRDKSKIGANVRSLAECFSGQGPEERYDPFTVLSAAFVMVYGELSKTRSLATKPPFWRRLAAFSQAALITRCVLSTTNRLPKFIAWMGSVRSDEYGMQCYVDLRCEPRWLGEFAMPRQLKDEIGGRVLVAAGSDEAATSMLGLQDSLIGDAPHSLRKKLNPLFTLLPGPLEGNIEAVNQLQSDHPERMRKDLMDPSPSVASFTLVANAALLFKLPEEVPQLAADAIRRAQYRLDTGGKRKTLQHCLVGLAIVAATTRSHQLADEVFIVVRNYRRFFRDELDLDAAFQIGMIACASRSDLDDWCKCVGSLVADLGFGELERGEAVRLHALLTGLCEIVPELWATCAQGIAAMEAVRDS